jgi:CheY-like chemotaxis protein
LALFQEDPYAFDVLMTDQMMPGMKGSDLTRHVLAIRPELPVILCTGYADALGPEQAAELGIREYILKPLDFSHLAKIIRSWFPADVPA